MQADVLHPLGANACAHAFAYACAHADADADADADAGADDALTRTLYSQAIVAASVDNDCTEAQEVRAQRQRRRKEVRADEKVLQLCFCAGALRQDLHV